MTLPSLIALLADGSSNNLLFFIFAVVNVFIQNVVAWYNQLKFSTHGWKCLTYSFSPCFCRERWSLLLVMVTFKEYYPCQVITATDSPNKLLCIYILNELYQSHDWCKGRNWFYCSNAGMQILILLIVNKTPFLSRIEPPKYPNQLSQSPGRAW